MTTTTLIASTTATRPGEPGGSRAVVGTAAFVLAVVAPAERRSPFPRRGCRFFALVTNGAPTDRQGHALPAGQASAAEGGALLAIVATTPTRSTTGAPIRMEEEP